MVVPVESLEATMAGHNDKNIMSPYYRQNIYQSRYNATLDALPFQGSVSNAISHNYVGGSAPKAQEMQSSGGRGSRGAGKLYLRPLQADRTAV